MSTISTHHLTKLYRKKAAVDDVSFDIEEGRLVGFLGPNGAGKTTTLRLLAGLIRPTRGSARVLGERVPGRSLRQVGTMIEEPSFYPYMTGRENLRYAATLHGGVKPRRIDEMLAFVGMDQAGGKKVAAYSQGMRQRLGLARALLWDPRVLLLDEPTNGLDPVGIAEIRESLRDIAASGVTILISSHILAEIEKLVERVLVIERGRLLFDGPVGALTRRVDTPSVAYRILATDQAALAAALEGMGYVSEAFGEGWSRAFVPLGDSASLLRRLAAAGVDVLEAHRESDTLESAYLRLLTEDGKPS